MKRILSAAVLAAVMLASSCGRSDAEPGTSPSAQSPAASQSAAPQSTAPTPAPTLHDGTKIEHLNGGDFEGEAVDDSRKEKSFIGQWRSVKTTSENAAFTYLELNVTEDGYIVTLNFDDGETSSFAGKYEVEDGVLSFDESFIDCTAYFFEDDADSLVIDNGTSLVFCEHLETEEEMRERS